ncbi:MAG: pro-sigmaK processing inhibitor BofA family protein [Candidatus Micrarchaeota archaeon]|nr:pro-sigmaK processing inhibitor BofA family protein [Candidatus Micrarchaeota archaeon]
MAWGLIAALFVSILVFYTLFHLMRRIVPLLMHGIFGVALFYALGYFGIIKVPITWITFLIAALGGMLGVASVIALAYLGVPF